jgi:multimeric flavodoxin WrbA
VLNQVEVKSCIGCFRCWHTTPGICTGIKGDEGEEIIKKIIRSDLVVFLTPLTFGGYSSELKKIIGRMLGLLQPGTTFVEGEVHHLKRYNKYPSILALAETNEYDIDEARLFKKLVERHSRNFYPPKHLAEVLSVSEKKQKKRIKKLIEEII